MRQPPRHPKARLLDRHALVFSGLQGLLILGVVLALYGTSLSLGDAAGSARATAFMGFVLSILALTLVNRSPEPLRRTLTVKNTRLWTVMIASCILLGLIFVIPSLHPVMQFEHLRVKDVLLALGCGLGNLACLEGIKVMGLIMESQRPGNRGDLTT